MNKYFNWNLVYKTHEILAVLCLFVIYPLFCNYDDYFRCALSNCMIFILMSSGIILRMFRQNKFCINKRELLLPVFLMWYAGCRLCREENLPMGWLLCIGGCITIYIYFRTFSSRKYLLRLLFISGLIQSCWYFFQLSNILPANHDLQPGTGVFSNTAFLSIYQVIAWFGGLYLWKTTCSSRSRLFILLGIGVLTFISVQLNSRASWLAFITGVGWLVINSAYFHKLKQYFVSSQYHRFYSSLTLLLCFLLLGFCYMLYNLRPASVQGRMLIWQVIIENIMQHPWIGSGTFQKWYMLAQANWITGNPGSEALLAGNTFYAFNELLRISAESGLIGLLLFVGVATVIFKQIKNRNEDQELLYFGAILISLSIFGCFSYPFSVDWLVFIIVAFVANVFDHPLKVSYRIPAYLKCICFSCMVFFMVFCLQQYQKLHRVDQLLTKAAQGKDPYIFQQLRESYCQLPEQVDFIHCYAQILYRNECYDEALPLLAKSFAYWPNSHLACKLGHCYSYAAQYKLAEHYYQLAFGMVPGHILPQYYLFDLYRETEQDEKARRQGHKLLKSPVKVVNATVLSVREQVKDYLNASIN